MKKFLGALAVVGLLGNSVVAQQCQGNKAKGVAVTSHNPHCALTGTVVAVSTNAQATGSQTVVEIAAGNKDFSTLVAAVKAAGLVETLSGKGPFTVFAPTNEAFAKLPKATLESLLKPENVEKLRQILLYHVVAGKVLAKDVVGLKAAKSAQGQPIAITVKGETVMLNGNSKVVATDIDASNGVVHLIDSVILPPTP